MSVRSRRECAALRSSCRRLQPSWSAGRRERSKMWRPFARRSPRLLSPCYRYRAISDRETLAYRMRPAERQRVSLRQRQTDNRSCKTKPNHRDVRPLLRRWLPTLRRVQRLTAHARSTTRSDPSHHHSRHIDQTFELRPQLISDRGIGDVIHFVKGRIGPLNGYLLGDDQSTAAELKNLPQRHKRP